MRLFTATFAHETNGFSPIPTNLDNFREGLLHRPHRDASKRRDASSVEGVIGARAVARGYDLVEGLHAVATPSAPINDADYAALRDEILSDLEAALPVDAVALFLHGAQASRGCIDCEGDLLSRVRRLVGPTVPIGVELDLHANISAEMIGNATCIIACKEYPHTDFGVRANELLDVLEACVQRRAQPVTSWRRLPIMGIFHTTREPMRGFIDKVMALERDPRVLSISIAHGFPWIDSPLVGAGIIVVTDNDAALADALSQTLAEELFSLREAIAAPRLEIDSALDQALQPRRGLCVLADTSDNAGGGAASDSTHILRRLLERGVSNAALGMLWDPVAVEFAFAAGLGARIPLRIGGKVGPLSGDPVDVEAHILALNPRARQFAFGVEQSLARTVAIDIGGIDVVLSSLREQTHSPECFTDLSIDLARKRLVVVKSAQHFRTTFEPLAEEIIYATGPGSSSTDFSSFTYHRLQRPIWPLDQNTTFLTGA